MTARTRVLFVSENLSGHATMHRGIRRAIGDHDEIDATFYDVPSAGFGRRLVSASIPGLGRLDLDLQPTRAQLALSAVVRAHLQRVVDQFDVVHLYTQNAGLLSAGMLRRRPTVVSTDLTSTLGADLLVYRKPTRFTPGRARLAQRLDQHVFDAATMVVGQSTWCAQSLRNDYGIAPERLRVIPFGIVVPEVAPTFAPEGLPQVTFVGARMERKGGTRLLRVWRRSLRDRCDLNLVTRDPVNPEPGVHVFSDITAGDPRLWEILARSAVFAFPSEMDSFGYAAIEAMAAGLPVIATRLHALPEIIEDGVSGVLIDPDDDQLAAALEMLLDDEDRRARIGAAARARVLERFDARVTTAQLVDVLLEAQSRFRR